MATTAFHFTNLQSLISVAGHFAQDLSVPLQVGLPLVAAWRSGSVRGTRGRFHPEGGGQLGGNVLVAVLLVLIEVAIILVVVVGRAKVVLLGTAVPQQVGSIVDQLPLGSGRGVGVGVGVGVTAVLGLITVVQFAAAGQCPSGVRGGGREFRLLLLLLLHSKVGEFMFTQLASTACLFHNLQGLAARFICIINGVLRLDLRLNEQGPWLGNGNKLANSKGWGRGLGLLDSGSMERYVHHIGLGKIWKVNYKVLSK